MTKEPTLDELLAEEREHDAKKAQRREKIKALAVEEAASIKEKIDTISSLSGISKFDLLDITKEEAIRHFGIRQRADNKQGKKAISEDDKIIKDYKEKNPKKTFKRENGETYAFKKGPVPNDVKKLILAEVTGIALEKP